MHTIDSFEDYVEPIDEAIEDIFFPVLFRQTEPLTDELRELFTLLPAQGGLHVDLLRSTMQTRHNGDSSWLNAVVLEEQDLMTPGGGWGGWGGYSTNIWVWVSR